MPCPFCKVDSKNCGCWYRKPCQLLLAVALLFVLSCASSPLPKTFLPMASHFLSAAQDIQQRSLKVYNAICAGRSDAPECAYIEQQIESAFGLTLDQLFVEYQDMNEIAKAALQ